jgi:hypothetical protein
MIVNIKEKKRTERVRFLRIYILKITSILVFNKNSYYLFIIINDNLFWLNIANL